MINESFHSHDGRLRVQLTIEDDGNFAIQIMATKVGTCVKATTEQDFHAVNVGMRGKIEDRF